MTRPMTRLLHLPLIACAFGSLLPLNGFGQAPAPGSTVAPAKLRVVSFVVSGNTLLPREQIDAVLARWTGERSLAELQHAAQAVQALYREAGYGAAVAFVPPQTLGSGQVAITVVEGRLAKVTVTGEQAFSEANIRASLPSLVEGQTPRVREIDAQIQLANENPAKRIEVLLQPGDRLGEVDATVAVKEQPVLRTTVGLDDTGTPATGRLRANLGVQHANLWGRDHVLAAQLQFAPEKPNAVAVASLSYRVPFPAAGMALDAYAAYSDVDGGTTNTPVGALQFAGEGRIAGLRLSRYLPRLGEIDQRLVVGLDHRDYINTCSIAGFPAGACGNAGESVSVQPLSVEYLVQQAGRRAWGLSIGLQHNLQIAGGRAGDSQFALVRPGSRPRYTLLRLGVFSGIELAEGWQLQGRLIGQYSPDALVPGEQFGIGGVSSVRGYDERELSGDSGASASLEVWGPDIAAALGLSSGTLRGVGFVDGGWVDNQGTLACRLDRTRCTLASLGIGLRYAAGPLQARVDLAHTLREAIRSGRHDTRLQFSVSYSF